MKKKKKGLFKNIKNVVSKHSEVDKRKKAEKKKLKKNKPKGYGARKAGAITFWVLFSFMFLFVFVNVIGGSDESNNDDVIAETSKITSPEIIEFARSFLYDYFNYDKEMSGEDRTEILSQYFANDIQKNPGINFGESWTSTLTRENIIIKDIEKSDENHARFTFLTKIKTEKELSDEEYKKMKKEDDDFQQSEEDGTEKYTVKTEVKKNKKINYIDLYVSVPVHLTDDGNAVVYNQPSYTFVNNEENSEIIVDKYDGLTAINDNEVVDNIQGFLETFFESYSQDSRDKLSYILEDKNYAYGLGKTLDFVEVNNIEVFVGKNKNEMIVNATVGFIQPDSDLNVTSNYMLVILKKEKRYVVKYINNENYIEELLNNKKSEDEQEDDEDIEQSNENNEEDDEQDSEEDLDDEEDNEEEKDNTQKL